MAKWRNKVVENKSRTTEGNSVPAETQPVVEQIQQPEPAPQPAPVPKPKPVKEVQKEEVINNNNNFDPKKTYLVVGGKIKEISSKSKYLLDMLIIEED